MTAMAKTILIADDNDSVAEPLGQLLQKAGYTTLRAIDGVDALRQIAGKLPDLLLLDLKMPRLHGVELLKKLRQSEKTKDLPVIVMTGVYRGDSNAAAARALGVESYLEKPFRAGDLLAAVARGLGVSNGEPIDRHLLRAFLTRFSGVLRFAIGGRQQQLGFINGTPIFMRAGVQYENFGDFLRKRGTISVEEYAYYLEPGNCRQETLVQMGCLDWPGLMQEKLSYLGSELVAAFAFPPFTVEPTPLTLPSQMQVLSINLPRILYGGYHMHPRIEAWQQLRHRHAGQFPILTSGFYQYSNFLGLHQNEQEFLQCIDGKTPLQDCLGAGDALLPLLQTLISLEMVRFAAEPAAHADPGMPLRRLFNLPEVDDISDFASAQPLENFTDLVAESDLQAGEIPAEAPAQSSVPTPGDGYDLAIGKKVRQTLAKIKDKNYYEVFGLRQGEFSFDKLKSKYFAYTHEFGPELLMQLSGEEASLVEEILSVVSTAYNTLSDVVKKERYDELLGSDKVGLGHKGDDTFQAQVQSQSGKVFIEMEEWDNAIKALQDAVNFDPENGDYLAHLGWAIYKNPANDRSATMRERARQMINRALTLQRTASGHAFKGWLLFEAGQENLAEGEFNKALKIDARNSMARKGLRGMQEKREQEKKGLFRKMFS